MNPIHRFLILCFITLLICLTSCDYQPYKQGRNLYNFYCATCHMDDGSGLKGLYPPLAGADYLAKNQENLACIIRYGLSDTILVNQKTYNQAMPGVKDLNEVQITNVINYINHAWGNDLQHVKVEDIQKSLVGCKKDPPSNFN